jgi:hypothetical protein
VIVLGWCLIIISITGCTFDHAQVEEQDWGEAYSVMLHQTNLDLTQNELPSLKGGVLRTTVEYEGGCQDHDFDLRYRRTSEAYEIWFYHKSDRETCRVIMRKNLKEQLFVEAMVATHVWLILPDGNVHVLR